MRLFLTIGTLFLITGCANRFGHRNLQTLIDVQTMPPRLTYYVLKQKEAESVLVNSPTGLRVLREPEFKELLNSQLQGLVSDNSVLTYSVGSYILAVQCPNGLRFQHFDATNNFINVVKLRCQ